MKIMKEFMFEFAEPATIMINNIIQSAEWSSQWVVEQTIDCPSSYEAGLFATGEIRQNIKFSVFGVCFWQK